MQPTAVSPVTRATAGTVASGAATPAASPKGPWNCRHTIEPTRTHRRAGTPLPIGAVSLNERWTAGERSSPEEVPFAGQRLMCANDLKRRALAGRARSS